MRHYRPAAPRRAPGLAILSLLLALHGEADAGRRHDPLTPGKRAPLKPADWYRVVCSVGRNQLWTVGRRKQASTLTAPAHACAIFKDV